VVSAGIDGDSADGIAGSAGIDLGLTEKTWLSVGAGKSSVVLPRGGSIDTLSVFTSIDHSFDPVGIQLGLSYWGDDEILDSIDTRGSLYWRNANTMISADYEYRDFAFDIFRDSLVAGRDVEFHAQGIGLSARFTLSDSVDLNFSGISYDYNVNLGRAANRDILDFISVTRLSLINSLIDHRARVGVDIDWGEQRWSLDFATWEGAVDGSTTNSTTLKLLTPIGKKTDLELGIGVDDSDSYGSVTLFSIYLYFYG
jgi:hypothetical protein